MGSCPASPLDQQKERVDEQLCVNSEMPVEPVVVGPPRSMPKPPAVRMIPSPRPVQDTTVRRLPHAIAQASGCRTQRHYGLCAIYELDPDSLRNGRALNGSASAR